MDKISNYIDIGAQEGADLVLDGRNQKLQGYENGFFLGPTLFDNVKTKIQDKSKTNFSLTLY